MKKALFRYSVRAYLKLNKNKGSGKNLTNCIYELVHHTLYIINIILCVEYVPAKTSAIIKAIRASFSNVVSMSTGLGT